jgi:MbtH protein
MDREDAQTSVFDGVVNDEEQYSIWQVGRPVPAGWNSVGERGTKEDCLAYIEEHWVDMRPRSVRLFHEADAGG